MRASGRTPARYDNTLRLQQAAETRERIVTAGSELLHGSSIKDWRVLTVRAVAERAGVTERTVYRHLGSARGLRDAVMRRLEEEAGVDITTLELGNIADITTRIFEYVSSYPIEPRPPLNPTLNDASQRQRKALLDAVTVRTPDWTDSERTVAAAIFDLLWDVTSYEHLVAGWELDREQAIRGLAWLITAVQKAVEDGQPPWRSTPVQDVEGARRPSRSRNRRAARG